MANTIYCRTTDKGTQSYYLNYGRKDYYLFCSDYRKSNKEFFGSGKHIDQVLSAKGNASASVRHACERIIKAVKYIESEYEICVFRKTAQKQHKQKYGKSLSKRSVTYAFQAV